MSEVVELLSMCRIRGVSWYFLAREAQRPGGMADLMAGRSSERSADATESLAFLRAARDELPAHRTWVEAMLAELAADGARLTMVLDHDYPSNLRLIFNLPPFLTYRGVLRPDDARSVGARHGSICAMRRSVLTVMGGNAH